MERFGQDDLQAGTSLEVGGKRAYIPAVQIVSETGGVAEIPDFYQAIAEGSVPGYSIVNKFGRNLDLDAGTEDVWNGGATYTGFPTGAPEEIQVVSTNAGDTGVLSFTYLASNTATAWQTATVTLNGTTPVNTGITAYRVHTAQYNAGTPTTFNLGDITVRHRTTTANVFLQMPVGRSQSNACVYTIPAGKTGYIKRIFGQVQGSGTAAVDFDLWVRGLNASPRLRRPNQAIQSDRFDAHITGGLIVPAGSDIKIQATATANNLVVIAGFDIVIKDNPA